ncbi:MAG: STT3 domain-containing protein [Candidatus ainarchaeum sp.]|nr:STT3 domain-containing protein [Candidatus ainarchaeum sp.]
MFVSFELPVFIAWLAVSSLIPGAILSFSLLRKEELTKLEKLFIGFGLGIILLPLIPFIAYLVFGITFSYTIALASVAILYILALVAFFLNRTYEDLVLPKEGLKLAMPETPMEAIRNYGIPLLLLLLMASSYMIRVSTYSPVFQELDPYYYTDAAQQLLTMGENPWDDQTAWYPEMQVSHRIVPALSYLEATWYSLYTSGADYSNMLLAVVASMYPPIAAVLAIFFIYLLVSAAVGREWGFISAGIAAFVPTFIYKLAAGEQEVQPYAFFALMFFFAMYVLSLKKGGMKFPVLAGIGFAAVALGSSSQILAAIAVILFTVIQAMLLFLRDKDAASLKELLRMNVIIFVIGPLLGSAILKDMFSLGTPSLSIIAAFVMPLAFTAVLYLIKTKVNGRSAATMALAAILLIGLAAYAFTPLGGYIKTMGKGGFEIAKYNTPLDRTIAEQGLAGDDFSGQIGFIAESYTLPTVFDSVGAVFNAIIYVVLFPFWLVANAVLALVVQAANIFLDSSVEFTTKAVSFLMFWLFFFWLALALSALRFIKKEDDAMFIFFLAIVMPPLLVGLIKAKYTIYAGVLLAVAIGFALGQATRFLDSYIKDKEIESYVNLAPFAIGVGLILFQFLHMGFAPSLLWGSSQTLYQNDPDALAAKFETFCSISNDAEVCAAAADPKGYASQGTNYQYSSKLCLLSVFSNYSYINNPDAAPSWETQSAYFRCLRLSDYWIDSMEWIKDSTPPGSRIISWWDYGHWINFFGQRNAVIRNEHVSHTMIGAVAHGYTDASPEELKGWMKAHDVKYALFDMELVAGGGQLGGKYGALNYLSCAWDNQTNVSYAPGESQCEADHLWETVFISSNPCTISSLTNKTGYTAYEMYLGSTYLSYYPSFCISPADPNAIAYCRDAIRAVPTYCVGEAMMADGSSSVATYYLDKTYPNGDLKLSKGLLLMPYQLQTTSHMGPVTGATIFYTKDAMWLENGEVKSGYEDRKGKFYDSALYQALFLNELPGFKLVYTTPSGAVKIYEIEE